MRRVFLAAAALTVALGAQAWAQTGPSGGQATPAGTPAVGSPAVGSSAGASTVSPLPPPGRPIPAMATLPRQQYAIDTGANMREWFPVVDTYLDSEVAPGHQKNQTEVKAAWTKLRAEWDGLQKVDDANWNAARTSFESAWREFEATWQKAKNQS